ncbi:hypothetical protein G7Y89_g740 [Cudoniella acicularis]|uniref:Uncharacterized protein n=1 Tax=Cudoniella acicularis TaxID=354080 RepID=A0A8H4RYK7_9HELO|nr:hypothetical protein G7Y89_g740 [Cudoniella acicularis]
MGLPLFIAPVEPEVASKVTEKSASVPRSAIRRHRTFRGYNARTHAAETRRRRILSTAADTTAEEYEVWEMQRTSPSNDGELSSVASHRERLHRIFEADRTRSRGPILSFERRSPPDAEADGPLPMPPVPETRDYYAIGERQSEFNRLRQRHELRRLARNPAPTPPYTDTDLAFLARTGSETPRTSSLTPALSPSRQGPSDDVESSSRSNLETPDLTSSIRGSSNIRGSRYTSERPTRSTLSERIQEVNAASMNNIERHRRLVRQARLEARLDGLGDRDRSLSPEGGAAWDTLLTSITPDPQPPSAGSSFASASAAAAAASSTSSSGSASASTSMTSMGPNEESSALRDCDMSDSGSNTEEDEDIYELQDFNRARGGRSWRSYAEAVQSAPEDAEELQSMHRIISTLAERDNIPESWWASAGLSRRIGEPST